MPADVDMDAWCIWTVKEATQLKQSQASGKTGQSC